MINVNQITAQLARMPDQALQQYAQMHKDDPYTLSLALAESNRRKQTRQGAQMGGQEQPKVVDQELQSMAAPMPEDVGIGQLPAGDMNFADGGIVAFSDGGDVPRYQSQGLVQYAEDPKLARQAMLRAYVSRFLPASAGAAAGTAGVAAIPAGMAYGLTSAMDDMRAQGYPVDPMGEFGTGAATPEQAEFDEARRRRAIEKMSEQERLRRFGTKDVDVAMQGGAFTPAGQAAATTKQSAATPAASAAEVQMAMNAGAFKPSASAAPGANQGQRLPSGGPGAAAPSASGPAAPATGITALQSPAQMYQNALEATPLVDPAAGQREALGKEMIGGAQQRMAARQAEIEKEGDVFKGRGERISKREEALGKDKEQMTGLAFLEAGLAVMSTPGGLATALGKGARVGTERFAAGLDKLRAAQERLEDAKDNLETLRLNRSDMNAKEIRAMKADIDRAKLDAQKLGIDGIMQASDLRYKQAGEIFKASSEQSLAVLKEAGANQRQQMASAATVQAAKIAAAQRGTRLEDELREQYAKSAVLRAQYPNVKDFLAAVQGTSAVPPVQAQPGAGGVRP